MFVYGHSQLKKCSLIFNLIAVFTQKGNMKKFENWRYHENKRSPDYEDKKDKKKKTIVWKLKQLNKLGFAVNNFIHVWADGKLSKEVMFLCSKEKCLVNEAYDPGMCMDHINTYIRLFHVPKGLFSEISATNINKIHIIKQKIKIR